MRIFNRTKSYYRGIVALQFVAWFLLSNMYQKKETIKPSVVTSAIVAMYTMFHIFIFVYASRKELSIYKDSFRVLLTSFIIIVTLMLTKDVFESKLDFSFPLLWIHVFLSFQLVNFSIMYGKYVEVTER